ncbi:MAG: DUF1206 domain-containing protein [Deltaproteobacteria bacterium]|nr:DUF1206 domain-containing protein [Deltaproteobacteria bacterium]MDQ3301638.1 DUF1206 domain-containing protein [Myxococcota bacterium]
MNVSSLSAAGHATSEKVAPWIEGLARVGFAAKGVLYLTIGALAASAALGFGGKTATDSRGAMSELLEKAYGRPLLAVIAIGLVGYAVWRVIDGIKDPERRGKSAKGIALRIGSVLRGLIHLGLAYTAGSLALWQQSESGGQGKEARHWTARALETPGGVYVLWAVAGAFFGYGLYQVYKAVKSKLNKQLELGRLAQGTRRVVVGVSRFGIAARGIVFGTIGVLLARAANREDAREAGGLSDSMKELLTLGKWPFIAIALGLAAYGVYQFINARYRRIDCT